MSAARMRIFYLHRGHAESALALGAAPSRPASGRAERHRAPCLYALPCWGQHRSAPLTREKQNSSKCCAARSLVDACRVTFEKAGAETLALDRAPSSALRPRFILVSNAWPGYAYQHRKSHIAIHFLLLKLHTYCANAHLFGKTCPYLALFQCNLLNSNNIFFQQLTLMLLSCFYESKDAGIADVNLSESMPFCAFPQPYKG